MIQAIHHITINVRDLNASLRFYGEFLGLPRLETVDMGDHRLDYFALPGGKLELISYVQPSPICTAGVLERGRFRHLALQTDDLAQIAAGVESYGGRVLQPPRWVEALQLTGMLAEDPNGCELEFVSTAR